MAWFPLPEIFFFFFFSRYMRFVWGFSVILSSFTKERISMKGIEGLHQDVFIGTLINMTVNGKGTIIRLKCFLILFRSI